MDVLLGLFAGFVILTVAFALSDGSNSSKGNTSSNAKRNTSLTKADYGRMGAKLGRSMARRMCKW